MTLYLKKFVENEILHSALKGNSLRDVYPINLSYTNQWGEQFAASNIDDDIVDTICRYIISKTTDGHENGSSISQKDYWVPNNKREFFLDSLPLYRDKPFTPHPRIESMWNLKFMRDNDYSEYFHLSYFVLLDFIKKLIKPRLEALYDMPVYKIKQNDYLSLSPYRSYKVQ